MRYMIIFSQLASEDLTEILGWYKTRDVAGLDKRFIEFISKTINRIEFAPQMYPIVHKNIRCALLKTFPYKILYYEDDSKSEVHIIAVIHQSRNPKIWKKRT